MAKPKKNYRVSSIYDVEVIEETKKTPLPEPPPALEVKAEVPAPKAEAKPFKSPLLSEPVDIKEHALGNGPSVGTTPQPSLSVGAGFFNPPPITPPIAPPPPLDAPEQNFNQKPPLSAGGGQLTSENIPIPDNISKQGASDLADTIMDLYKRVLPEVAHTYTKINTKEIKKLEQSGDLLPGAYTDVVEENKNNKALLTERAKEDAALIKKPLKKLLEVKNINAPPHIELIIILIFVAVTYFLMVKDMKRESNALLEKLYERIRKEKGTTGATVQTESEIPLTETETVIK